VKRALRGVALALALGAPGAAAEEVAFPSITPRGPSDLVAGRGAPAVVPGVLTLPQGAERAPAVVLLHGSRGLSQGRERAWAERLGRLGLATLVVDSFGPRGVSSTALDQSQLSTAVNVADAVAALRFLSAHPRVDPARIAVIGFSRGGQAALYAALEPFRRGAGAGALRFAAHVALYPSCSLPYRAQATSGAPILFALGGADDYTPAAHCLRYAEWFRTTGSETVVAVYGGAHHGFDMPEPPRRYAMVQTARDCDATFELEPTRLVRGDGVVLSEAAAIAAYIRGCVGRGATFGGSPAALARAEADVAAFLRRALGLR
jgi:dienelactone hydrolase